MLSTDLLLLFIISLPAILEIQENDILLPHNTFHLLIFMITYNYITILYLMVHALENNSRGALL